MRSHFGIKTGVRITLHKSLPIGAGIGGGSSDAAAILKLLIRLWKIDITEPDLDAIALSIGADVPACLRGAALYMRGIGEIIDKAPTLPGLHMVLVHSGNPLLTKDVFAKYDGKFSPARYSAENICILHGIFRDFLYKQKNDLQNAAHRINAGNRNSSSQHLSQRRAACWRA